MILYLCEKPSQARDIGKVLGVTSRRDGYLVGPDKQVTWCVGHLLEMIAPDGYKGEWKSWRMDTLPMIPDRWKLEVKNRVGKQYTVIRTLLKSADEVVLATDADREGETIGREVLDRCRYRGKISRLWLSALDDASIQKALNNLLPGEKTQPLYQAGLGRARADWLVGMNLSRAYTILGRQRGYDGVLTVGRVQTPTLKLVVDRDRQIENFIAVDFFDLLVLLKTEGESCHRFVAKWLPDKKGADEQGRCLDRARVEALCEQVGGQSGPVVKAETNRIKEPPPLPLELSTLQQEASRKWSLGAKRVLELAQALYEKHKAITYPRTDCRYLPQSQFLEAPVLFRALSQSDPNLHPLVEGADSSQRSKAWNDKKITAHHAIIPTTAIVNVAAMSFEEQQLYDLIRRYYLAQFYPAYEYDKSTIDTQINAELFRASGRVERLAGWKILLRNNPANQRQSLEARRSEQKLPAVKKGETLWVEKAKIEEKKTKPPPRYSEGTLIQTMKNVGRLVEDRRLRKILRETAGIGTEATRASIIENLLMRKLLVKEGKKNLISQPAGRALIDMLPHSVTDPATTAVWEQALDDIAQGEATLDGFLTKSVTWINRLVGNVKERERLGISQFSTHHSDASMGSGNGEEGGGRVLCPLCGKVMRPRKGPNGLFLGCSGYPNCRATQSVPKQSTPTKKGASSLNERAKGSGTGRSTSATPTPAGLMVS
ncbi:MAG: DNA topoisomerase III [Magnetococcales bacterium]|nr:DNA topoisomerase III [Magnetococcales bacterium]